MAYKNKFNKNILYIPATLGALAFAVMGITSLVRANAESTAGQSEAVEALPAIPVSTQTLQPNGGACGPQYCAACGFCAGSRLQVEDNNRVYQAEITIE